ncbi:septal ring lytic transglycosylase RlpA family protein [Phreatobacter stygius]|uniref:septal ring lytic transglycosylase RlpA family protein n=1 Tax=Phreatobacter stygius TaxID=1940610 RepID=UPI00319DBA7B
MTTTGVSRATICDRKMALRYAALAGFSLIVAGCASQDRLAQQQGRGNTFDQRYGVSSSPRVVQEGQPVPRGGGVYRIGRPYMVGGRRYTPFEKREGHAEVGMASWYGRQFHGRLTANGEVYDMTSLTAAHRTMPMPSYARVTNLRNGHSIIVRVNDRGPFHANRVVDLSSRASHLLDFRGHGVARVKVEYVGRAPLEGSDDRMLLATLRTDGSAAPTPTGLGAGVMVASAAPAFVPQTPAQPAVVENRGIPSQLSEGMPLPPERPFDLGLSAGGGTTVVASAAPRQAAPAVATPVVAAAVSAAPAMAPVPAPAPVSSPAPAVAAVTQQPPALASAASRPVTVSTGATTTTTAFAAPPPPPVPAIAAMPGAPAARASFGVGGLY